jgi:hypothetical protein
MTEKQGPMGVQVCYICEKEHSPIPLVSQQKSTSSESKTYCIGKEECPECKANIAKGYVVLIETDFSKSQMNHKGTALFKIHRTGRLSYVRKSSWVKVFDPETLSRLENSVAAVDSESFDKLTEIDNAA